MEDATLASVGLLPTTNWPVLCRTPFPASGNHCQSLPVWAPYLAIEKLESLARPLPNLATHPIMGIVTIDCAPAVRLSETKVSIRSPGVELLSPMLSKYQSDPRLSAL